MSKKPQPARRPATIKTIADELSLSPSTVSRALQGDSVVKAKTRALIIEVAERLGYRRDFRGVNLRTGKTFTLCAVLANNPPQEFGDPATMHLIQGLIAGVEGTDFNMVILPVEGADQRLKAVRQAVTDGRFDGIIIDHTVPRDPCVMYLLEHDMKFVSFGRTELFSEHAYFDIDNEHAAYAATAHLIAKGHRRIALIGPPSEFLFASHRLRGYRRALEDGRVPYDETLVNHLAIGARAVREGVTELLDMPDRPTGFVTSNEMATLGTISACRTLPPSDFSRIAFASRDGTSIFDYVQPWVSSCYYPLLEAGRHLAETLIQAVEGAPIASLQRLEKTVLIERPSLPKPPGRGDAVELQSFALTAVGRSL